MKLLITGATGLIGTAFVRTFQDTHEYGFVGRNKEKIGQHFSHVSHKAYSWDEIKDQGANILAYYDAVINLAGENIGAKRWSEEQKKSIIDSRVDATRLIAEQAVKSNHAKLRILNASAIGVYGFAGDIAAQNEKIFLEKDADITQCDSFLAQVGHAWEAALVPAEVAKLSVTKMRFGVVLSDKGGALPKMLPTFRLGFGAVLGSGEQPFAWIALSDLVRAIEFILENPKIKGAINLVSSDIVSQKVFADQLAKVLRRPRFLTMPSFIVKAMFGEMGEELLLNGQKVSNQRLLEAGFTFHYLDVLTALQHEISRI